ncbi:MAG TPA: hypothetical protein VEK81_08310 [Burkholderiales bacterium]|nr:hypothetical protein [Burkholderiales bacterium]
MRANAGDLRPNHGAVDQVVAQHPHPGVIARRLEIGVQEAPRRSLQSVLEQVHREEGDFARHVDPAQLRIELDAIEGQRPPFEKHDVPQMQVAVALAHETAALAPGEDFAQPRTLAFGPGAQTLESRRVARIRVELAKLPEVGERRRRDMLRRAERASLRRRRNDGVERRHRGGDRVDLVGAQLAALCRAVGQRFLGEAPHLERVLDWLARSA